MNRFDMNLVEIDVEFDGDLPRAIVWNDGRRFIISSSGAPVPCPSHTPGKFAYIRDVYIIGSGRKTYRRSIIADGGKWYVASLK